MRLLSIKHIYFRIAKITNILITFHGISILKYESLISIFFFFKKTFVEKVITETSLPEVLAKTINRKLYGEAKSENTARSSDNKNVEEGQKVECDKLMDEIMLTVSKQFFFYIKLKEIFLIYG